MKIRKKNLQNNFYILKTHKENFSDLCVKYIPLFTGCFLLMSLLFNVGYFILTSHQYITFLSYADYIEGTMPFIVIYILFALFLLTQPISWLPKIADDFELYMNIIQKKDFLHQLIYKKVIFRSFVGHYIQELISNGVIQDEYYYDPIKQYETEQNRRKIKAKESMSKRTKIRRIIVKIRKVFRPIKKFVSFILFVIINLAIIGFILLFMLISVLGAVIFYPLIIVYIQNNISSNFIYISNLILFALYIYTIYNVFIYINKGKSKLQMCHLIIIILCFYAPILGELKFVYDWKHPKLEVYDYTNIENKYLIRAISGGYFVKDKNDFLYLPKKNIRNISLRIKKS